MPNTEKEFMEKQFAKAVNACNTAVKKRPYVKEFTVLKKDKFWATWAKVNGYSSLVKKTHRFVAVLRLNFGGYGDICFSASNRTQPEIAVLDVLNMAIAGWTPTPDSQTVGTLSKYGSVAKAHFNKVKRLMDAFVKAMETPDKMNQKELDRIISMHQHWLKHDCEAWEQMQADLSMYDLCNADLSGASLHGANLRLANLRGADLHNVDLRNADLSGASLHGADLHGANLHLANLHGADLHGADLHCANLNGANLRGADLHCANLSGADLVLADIYTADFDKKDEIRKGVVLKKAIKGYKKTAEGVVITAEIPAGAIVFSINGRKCRTSTATILDMEGHKVLHSQHDPEFTYRRGKKIIIPDFDSRYNVECGKGFHFFRSKKEAKTY